MNREPVMTAGTLAGLVAGVIALLIAFGVGVTPEQQKSILDFIPAVFAFAAPIVAAYFARKQVTPVADPKNDQGVPLIPATERERGTIGEVQV